MNKVSNFIFILSGLLMINSVTAQKTADHYLFFSQDREGIHDSAFYLNPGVTGAQITYPWKELEPQKDRYNFTDIEEDLGFLKSKGKGLFIQIQDVSFDSTRILVPKYLLEDPEYNGGASICYAYDAQGKPFKGGWMARRWDPAVAARFHKLLQTLARQYDGKIAGINLPESSFGETDEAYMIPEGFTEKNYLSAIKENMLILRTSFEKSVPIQYANFMPGNSPRNLKNLYAYAKRIGVGMGGPDIKVYRPFQMKNSYPLIRELSGVVPTGMAVQEGNYDIINPQTGKQVTVKEILDFAENYLKLKYVFWCTEEPYYSKQVLPMLRAMKNR